MVTEKHSNYLASRLGSDSRYYTSEWAVAATMAALAAYDEFTGSTQPDLSLEVRSDPVDILSAEFSSNTDSIVETTVPFNDLATPPNPLTFTASGTGMPL